MEMEKIKEKKPVCPVCNESSSVIENPFQDNDPGSPLYCQFWCISCDRKFNVSRS